MSNQNLRSLHGTSYNELEEPSLHQYAFCGECQEHVLEYCSIHGPGNSKKEENFERESPQVHFSVNVKMEHCNSDDEIQNDGISTNPTTNSSEASEKNPDEKLSDFLAILEQCTSSLNVTEDVILLDENGDFELSELVLNSENQAEKDAYLNRIQAQLDEEIMRDIEAEAKIFEAIKVSLIIPKESFEKKSEENMSLSKVFKRTELIAENEDMCESGLIIVDSGVEDIAILKDSVQEGAENNFHSEIVNWNKALDYIDDGEEDITQRSIDYNPDGYKINNGLVKEMLENLCKEHSKELVKDKRRTSTFIQIKKNDNNEETKGIRIKSKRKLQTTKKSVATKKATFQNNDEDAGETVLESETNFQRNTFIIMKQNYQGPLSKKIVDVSSKKKSKETNTYVVRKKQKIKTANKYKYTEKGNIKDAQNIAKFKCNECGKDFSTKDILTDHVLKCIKPKSFVKDGQLEKADTLNSLLSEVYICDICTFKTNQKRSIETHLKMHSITKWVSCDTCEYRCAHKSQLKNHIRTHTGEKPFSCNICDFKCSQKSHLKNHIKTHTGEKPFTCNICDFKCLQKSTLKNHIRTHTGEKPYSCNICEYRCSKTCNLKDHIKTHTGEKPFTCNICDFKCSQKSTLKNHIRTHTCEKPYSCNICEYRCSQKSTLKNHIRTHTGEKPYSCNICEYRCSKTGNLKDHIRTHTGEKPFTCNICDFKCSQKSTLNYHIRTHTGEKPYSCNICEYRCSQKSNLKNHVRTHTGEKPFSCNICSCKYARKSNLNAHLRTHN